MSFLHYEHLIAFSLIHISILLFSYSVAESTLGNPTYLNTISGRKIPFSALSDFFHPTDNDVESNIFEVVNDSTLKGVGVKADLTLVSKTHVLPPQEEPQVYIDGKLLVLKSNVKIQIGPHFTTVRDAADGTILHLWSDNMNLVPLGSNFPGIFVNTARFRFDNNGTHANDVAQWKKSRKAVDSLRFADIPAFPDVLHTFGGNDDTTDTNYSDRVLNKIPGRTSCSKRYPRKVVEIAVAFDSMFCNRFDRDARKAVSVLRALTSSASVPYEQKTCLKLKLVHIDGYCDFRNDPYIGLQSIPDVEEVLRSFKVYWYRNKSNVKRDIAVYFTGWDDGTTILGVAYIGFACSQFGYALVELANRHVYAHEIGHTLNARHTSDGIMQAYYSKLEKFEFSNTTVKEVVDFVDNRRFLSSCLQEENFSPTPTPKPPSKTCGEGFPKFQVLLCKRYQVARLSAMKGKVIVSIRIENNVVEVQMVTNYASAKIWYVVSFISLRKDLSVQETGKMFGFERVEGVQLIRQRWRMDDLSMPARSNSCCGATYYLYAWAVTCTNFDCTDEYVIHPFKLPCGNPCKGKPGAKVLPMSPFRKCPVCISGKN